jgi:hypothetical protein
VPKYTNNNLTNYTQGTHNDQSIINDKYRSYDKKVSHELGNNVVKDETKSNIFLSIIIYLIVGLIVAGLILKIVLSII